MLKIFFFMSLICFVMIIFSLIISKKGYFDREKNTSFECGFDPWSNSRLSFSMRFFMLSVIFLIFDVEICLILPLIVEMMNESLEVWSFVIIFFISFLVLGVVYEWMNGAFEWVYF